MQFTFAKDAQLLQVKNWFPSFEKIYTWGGPNMTYPMSDAEFLKVIKGHDIHSYCLLDNNQQLVAFGQFYNRLERNHLGRLAVAPHQRGKGLGKKLIRNLLAEAQKIRPNAESSLFVFSDNQVAYQCYQSIGFSEAPYPGGVLSNMQNCVFMVLPPENSDSI